MTKRLELYDWPKERREIAQEMYKIARVLLLEARRLRRVPCPGQSARTARHAAKLILDQIRMGRDHDVWYHRKVVRESVERVILKRDGKSENLGGYMFDQMCVKGTGLDQPEFDEKA